MKTKIKAYLPTELAEKLCRLKNIENALEIRLRAERPVFVRYQQGKTDKLDFYPTSRQLNDTLELLSGYSLYAHNRDISRGFITVDGWRIGIGGAVIFANDESKGISAVSSLNIRVPRQIKGCGEKIMPYISENSIPLSTLIVSPPMCGKTTLLRDLIRCFSNSGINTAVIDERGEIASISADGIPYMDVGLCTDVLSGCNKSTGMMMALRSLAPQLIALDEIGVQSDVGAINRAITGGVSVICTVHAKSREQLLQKKYIYPLIADKLFRRYVFLHNIGEVSAILDEELINIW